MTFRFIEGHLPSSFPGFECSDIVLWLGGVSGSLGGVVKYHHQDRVLGEEAYCGLDSVTKSIAVD